MTSVSPIIGIDHVVSVTPVISTTPYSANDQIGGIQVLQNVFPSIYRSVNPSRNGQDTQYKGKVLLQSLSVVDTAIRNARMKVFLFNELPTVASADNDPLNIASSEAPKCVGVVDFAPTYVSTGVGNFSVGSESNINLMISQSNDLEEKRLYAVVRIEGSTTFTATNNLRFIYGFFVD